jgi:hypothetical protein
VPFLCFYVSVKNNFNEKREKEQNKIPMGNKSVPNRNCQNQHQHCNAVFQNMPTSMALGMRDWEVVSITGGKAEKWGG